MRLRNVGILAMCICTIAVTGCKSTPKTESITQKTGLSKVIEEKSIKVGTKSIASIIGAPEKEEFQLVSDTGITTLNVDAEVIVPDTKSIPVVTVEKEDLSNLDLEKLTNYFFEGEEVSMSRELEDMSKAEIGEMIQQQKDYMADESIYEVLSEEELAAYKQENEDQLQELEEYYETAPEVAEEIPVEYSLKSYESEYQGEDAKIFGVEYTKDTETKYFQVNTGNALNQVAFFPESGQVYVGGVFEGYENKCKYSQEEAEKKCQEILELLHIDGDYALESCQQAIKDSVPDAYSGYVFIYKKSIEGVTETFEPQTIAIASASSEGTEESGTTETAAEGTIPRGYEELMISFDESGINSLFWKEPEVVENIVAENVEVISYEKALEIFKDQVFLKSPILGETVIEDSSDSSSSTTDISAEKVNANIDKIRLGLMRVKDSSTGGYMMVPVYDFFMESDLFSPSILTINALDGSIIDRSLGY